MPGESGLLLVEDDPVVERLMVRILDTAGWAVTSVATADAALAAPAPCIAVVDLGIEPEGGVVLGELLRAREPGLPLVFVSGNPPDGADRAWIVAAEAHFVAKPFSPGELIAAVEAARGAGA